jgi:hypothetical protein
LRGRRRDSSFVSAVSTGAAADRYGWLWILPVAALIAFKYVTSLGVAFNRNDDNTAYLYQVARLLQTGSVGVDPFSNRQLLSLNGQTLLLGLMCSATDFEFAHLLDPGIGWIVIGGCTWTLCRRRLGGSPRASAVLTLLALMVSAPAAMNLSGNLTGAVLFLTLVQTAWLAAATGDRPKRSTVVLFALTLAALCAVKTTFLLFGLLFAGCWHGLRMMARPHLALAREALVTGLLVSAFVLPWMCQQYRSSGTPFYPLLGKGYHPSSRGLVPTEGGGGSLASRLRSVREYVAHGMVAPVGLALLTIATAESGKRSPHWQALFACTLSVFVGSLLTSFLINTNYAVIRYTQPILQVALILAAASGLTYAAGSLPRIALAVCLALFVGNQWENLPGIYGEFRGFVAAGRYGNLLKEPRVVNQLRGLQASIPPGKRLLISHEDGFLLDFSRNSIWSLDLPGMASPPPGLPVADDPSALRQFVERAEADRFVLPLSALPASGAADRVLAYLREVGVDYVAFPRRGESAFYLRIQHIDAYPIWRRTVQSVSVLVHRELLELPSKCQSVYDDGEVLVLDLHRDTTPITPEGSP